MWCDFTNFAGSMKKFAIIVIAFLVPTFLSAQRMLDNDNERVDEKDSWGKKKDDKKKEEKIPTGLRVWQADDRFGKVDSVAIDSFSHNFQSSNYTEGIHKQYNTLGNMGSPRLSRLFTARPLDFSYFIFANPYDFFITPFSNLHFTNTKSPFTNITYHESMGSDTGEDRIKAIYAINMDKDIGFGLKLDYLYGRGYYDSQATADFNATLFGSILKDQYQAHYAFYSNYLKTAENGGITADDYVTNPENFPSKFGTNDIPTRLSKTWNKIHVDGLQWTHSYSLGIRKGVAPDSTQQKKPLAPGATASVYSPDAMLPAKKDTILHKDSTVLNNTLFIPVTSFIHTLKIQNNTRDFIANKSLSDFYTEQYLEGDSTLDKITNVLVSNLFAVELHEGFNKWALAGIRLYAQHDFNKYTMPATRYTTESFNENRISVGGQILKSKGKNLNYVLEGQTSSDGSSWGDFKLLGDATLNVKLFGDSISLRVNGSVINRQPTFFYRKYQSHNLWWDNDLDKQMTTRLGAVLSSRKSRTRLAFDIQNIKKYTYFASSATQVAGESETYYTNNTEVRQSGSDIQLVSLVLNQDFQFGILNWENEIAYQQTSDETVLPLPKLSLYSNLYLLFRIAKVLRIEFGGNVRYFSSYYAPTYSPAIGNYTIQADEDKVKIGNYPVVDVYANFHLKHTRFYIMASHVNYSKSSSGSKFMAPHYPINPFAIRLGLSWNFFN